MDEYDDNLDDTSYDEETGDDGDAYSEEDPYDEPSYDEATHDTAAPDERSGGFDPGEPPPNPAKLGGGQ